jgi:molybdopterin synthase catalytic subunit
MLIIQTEPIDVASLLSAMTHPTCGAVVLFLGTVRAVTGDRHTLALDYEAYPELAAKESARLVALAQERWPIHAVRLVHRVGHLLPGEISVALAVSCPHRAEAFAAAQFLIDEMKKSLPIWKRELCADGTTEWVDNLTSNLL